MGAQAARAAGSLHASHRLDAARRCAEDGGYHGLESWRLGRLSDVERTLLIPVSFLISGRWKEVLLKFFLIALTGLIFGVIWNFIISHSGATLEGIMDHVDLPG
jgi:hypothetical protein